MLQIYKGYVIVEVEGPQYDVYDYATKYNRLVRFRHLQGAERWIDKRLESKGAEALADLSGVSREHKAS